MVICRLVWNVFTNQYLQVGSSCDAKRISKDFEGRWLLQVLHGQVELDMSHYETGIVACNFGGCEVFQVSWRNGQKWAVPVIKIAIQIYQKTM